MLSQEGRGDQYKYDYWVPVAERALIFGRKRTVTQAHAGCTPEPGTSGLGAGWSLVGADGTEAWEPDSGRAWEWPLLPRKGRLRGAFPSPLPVPPLQMAQAAGGCESFRRSPKRRSGFSSALEWRLELERRLILVPCHLCAGSRNRGLVHRGAARV